MIEARAQDKVAIIDILSSAFDKNKSVNYIVGQQTKRIDRIRRLMEYSFDICFLFGKVYLSDDKKACALILFHDCKKTTRKTIVWDIKLALSVIGLHKIKRVLDRETKIKKGYPKEPFYYIWFIGVDQQHQHKGIGSALLKELIGESKGMNRAVYLETSMVENLPFYQRFGFKTYQIIDFTYRLYSMKLEHTY